jgi:hypothetical protein
VIGGVAALMYLVVWITNSPKSLSDIIYLITLAVFTYCVHILLRRLPKLTNLLVRFWVFILIFISISAILSFFAFNFNLLPYNVVEVNEDYQKYYFNPLFGYVHAKQFSDSVWGRACHFMLEPSYLAFFLTTNFFFLDSIEMPVIKRNMMKVLVLAGALATLSTGAWVVLGIVFVISVMYDGMKKLRFNEYLARGLIYLLLLVAVLAVTFVPKDKVAAVMGTSSSFEDRDSRVQLSMVILLNSGVKNLILGSSPAYIEKTYGKGESNQIIKLLVEEGVILTILVLVFIVYCTKHNFKFFLSAFIFLNSVVILWTPLVCINLVLCRVLSEKKQEQELIYKKLN